VDRSLAHLVRDTAVHRSVYLDPDIFAYELERIFGSTWVYVAHESELPETGDFKRATIGLNPIIVVRGADAQVHVVFNRCAHRGVTVCQAQAGHTSFFRCAYHGWTYDLSGNLTGAPFPKAYDDSFDRTLFGLRPVPRVESYRGFVFACLDANVCGLREWLAGAAEYIDAFTDSSPTGSIVARSGSQRYWYKGNWKLQVEGSVDGYHPYVLHKTFFDMQTRRSGQRSDMYSREDTASFVAGLGNGHAVVDSRPEFAKSNVFLERMRMSPGGPELIADLERQYGADQARELVGRVGGNGFNIVIFPNLVLIQAQIRVIQPIAVDRTEVQIWPVTLDGVPARLNQMRLRAHELFFGPAGFGSPDDLEAFNRTQAGLAASPVEWMDFSRGTARERRDGERVTGEVTDETHQRDIYRTWLRLMAGVSNPALAVT
jgi:phenylpropionate dioxygenase-like ring-hydroxylating dioxygenase large terminal subunit